MVSNKVCLVLLSVLALSLGACGGDDGEATAGSGGTSGMGGDGDGDGDGASNDVEPAGICARVAAIQCAAQEDCCEDPNKQTVAACMTEALDNCEDLAAVAADDRVAYDRAAMKTALDDYQTRAAACDPSVAERAVGASGFATAFDGTVAAGGDCLPTGGADTTDFTDLGAALASCMNSSTTACLPTATTWTCAARGGADSPCFTDLNCQDGLYCNNDDAQTVGGGVCTARKAAAAACNSANECESFVCTSGSCASDNVQEIFCY